MLVGFVLTRNHLSIECHPTAVPLIVRLCMSLPYPDLLLPSGRCSTFLDLHAEILTNALGQQYLNTGQLLNIQLSSTRRYDDQRAVSRDVEVTFKLFIGTALCQFAMGKITCRSSVRQAVGSMLH